MLIGITHCYTDLNKGDAEIIIATIKLVKKCNPDAKIALFSVFGCRDIRFASEHNLIREHADYLLPAVFPNPTPIFSMGDKSRLFRFIYLFLRSSSLLLFKSKLLASLLLSHDEFNSFNIFLSCDILISKGGSYITTQNTGPRQLMSLFQMLFPFLLARRYNLNYAIFSQSIGPLEGPLARFLTKIALKKVSSVYLRESDCLNNYPYLRKILQHSRNFVIPDTAFYFDDRISSPIAGGNSLGKGLKVGVTIVDHSFKYVRDKYQACRLKNAYCESIKKAIIYLVNYHNATVTIFPQVTINDPNLDLNDLQLSRSICAELQDKVSPDSIIHIDDDLSPSNLRFMYSKMDIFIATRLHSAIFALSTGVPAINIAYHGTKSSGVYKSVFSSDSLTLDINSITPDLLISKVEDIIDARHALSQYLSDRIPLLQAKLFSAMKEIVQNPT